jgi:hypothetical protein
MDHFIIKVALKDRKSSGPKAPCGFESRAVIGKIISLSNQSVILGIVKCPVATDDKSIL